MQKSLLLTGPKRWKEGPRKSLVFMVFVHVVRLPPASLYIGPTYLSFQLCHSLTTVGRNGGRRPSLFRQNFPYGRMVKRRGFPQQQP